MKYHKSILYPALFIFILLAVIIAVTLNLVSSIGISRIGRHGKESIFRNIKQQVDLHIKDNISLMNSQADLLREMELVKRYIGYRNRTGNRDTRLEKKLRILFHKLNLVLFRIRDSRGRVVFRESKDSFNECNECPPPLGLLDAEKGRDVILVDKEGGSWLVLCIVPVSEKKRITGTLTLGFVLDDLFLREIASRTSYYNFDISLGSFDGIYATSLPHEKLDFLDKKKLIASIENNTTIIDDYFQENKIYYYDLIRILDYNYSIIIGIDSSEVISINKNARNIIVLTLSILFITILLIAIIFLLNLFRPLRSLRERVEKTASDITGIDISTGTGDEISGLVEAFDHMEMVLREHIVARDKIEISFMRAKNDALEAKKSAEDASRAKSKFLANMSHEIRTPMNGIIGITDLILEMQLGREQRILLTMVKKSAGNLLEIINDILDISRIESGKLSLLTESFKLRKLIDDTVKLLAINAHNKGLEIAYYVYPGVPDNLVGDPGRLRQVLINLIGNSVKFTEQGSVMVFINNVDPVSSETGYLFGGDENPVSIEFKVEDTGIGISEENSRIIFDTFMQGDLSYSRSYGGTGLGLAISSQLVTLMGGKIWLESSPGKGSRFFFTADFVPDSHFPSRWILNEIKVNDDISKRSVLVYDPYKTEISLVEEMLKRFVSTVFSSSDENLVLNELEKDEYDYCIINEKISSPANDLIYNRIIESRSGKKCRYIVLTSSVNQPGRLISENSFPAEYILKPVSESDLINAMRISVERFEQREPPDDDHWTGENINWEVLKGSDLLVVEDDLVSRELMKRLLKKRNIRFSVAVNGYDAINSFRSRKFNAVIMDIQLPGIDGIQVTTEIREMEKGTGVYTPIIALSAHVGEEFTNECLGVGMDGFITKPVKPENLYSELVRILSKREKVS